MSEALQQVGMGLDCYSEAELSAPVVQKNSILSKFPGPDSPLICKLVPDLLRGKVNGKFFEYFEVQEHGHIGGIDKTGKPMIFQHPCQKSLGASFCPECNRYWDEYKRLQLAGGEDTFEGKEIKKVMDMLSPKQKAWVYFITPESDSVKAVKLPRDLMNKLWGKAKTKWKDAIPSLIDDMKSKGMSPYDLKTPIGWLSLCKTGEKLGTTYHAAMAQKTEVIMENGRSSGTVNKFVSANVSQYLLTSFDISSLVDFRKIEQQRAFTAAESEAFAKNPFITPERIVAMFKKDEATTLADAGEAGENQSTSVEKLMAEIGPSSKNLAEIDDAL